MDNYYDDDDFIEFPSEEWEKIAHVYIQDIYEGPYLIIEKEYDDFKTCFNESKDRIYRKMLDVYENIKDLKIDEHNSNEFNLCVLATIDDCPFNTHFPINKDVSDQIISVIIPHMESIEDYESCIRARKLYHHINR